MTSLPLGLLFFGVVLFYTMQGSDASVFLNAHSVILVFGGSIAILLLSTPMAGIKALWQSTLGFMKIGNNNKDIQSDLMALIQNKSAPLSSKHPLMTYAQDLWEKGIEGELFAPLMRQKREELDSQKERAVAALRNLAKYPPALGMTGTVIGLVALFSKLTPDNKSNLGPLIAMAMTATFYGLVLANGLIMPLSDRLYIMHIGDTKLNEQILKNLLLINRNEASKMIEDEVYEVAV